MARKIICVCESPNKSNFFAGQLAGLYPDDSFIVISVYRGAIVFDYPSTSVSVPIPFLSAPAYVENKNHKYSPVAANCELPEPFLIKSVLETADEVWLATEADGHGDMLAFLFAKVVMDEDCGKKIVRVRIRSYSAENLQQALEHPELWLTDIADTVSRGTTKHYFDWNYNVNARVVFGDVLRQVGCTEDVFVSKYLLLLLSVLKEDGPLGSELLLKMSRWKGTGKYPGEASPSAATLGTLLDRLQTLPLVTAQNGKYGLSILGNAFMDRLHIDTCDKDLPFRINEWCDEGLDVARASIDRYITTYFGKQMNFSGHG